MKRSILISMLAAVLTVTYALNYGDSTGLAEKSGISFSAFSVFENSLNGIAAGHGLVKFVYICNDSFHNEYHKFRGCPRLNGCAGEVLHITKKQAKIRGYKKCDVCY